MSAPEIPAAAVESEFERARDVRILDLERDRAERQRDLNRFRSANNRVILLAIAFAGALVAASSYAYRLSGLRHDYAILSAENTQLRKDRADARDKADDLERTNAFLIQKKIEAATLARSLADATNEEQHLQQKLKAQKNATAAERQKTKQELTDVTQRLSKLGQEKSSVDNEVLHLNQTLALQQQLLQDANKKLQEREQALAATSKQVHDQDAQLQALKQERESMVSDTSRLRNTNQTLLDNLSKLRASVDLQAQQLVTCQTKCQPLANPNLNLNPPSPVPAGGQQIGGQPTPTKVPPGPPSGTQSTGAVDETKKDR